MIWIIANWKSILSAIITAMIAWTLHSFSVYYSEKHHADEMIAQKTQLNLVCAKEKAITESVSNDYQKSLFALNSRYSALRVQHSRCVALSTSDSPFGRDAASTVTKFPREDGVTSDSLFGFARDCEQVRLQLINAQSFISKVQNLTKE